MHIQAFSNQPQLEFIPPKACLGNVVICNFNNCLHQAVVMQCNFDIENHQWRYQCSMTVTPASITCVFDRDNAKSVWNGQHVMSKHVTTLLQDQLITVLDADIKAVVQSH